MQKIGSIEHEACCSHATCRLVRPNSPSPGSIRIIAVANVLRNEKTIVEKPKHQPRFSYDAFPKNVVISISSIGQNLIDFLISVWIGSANHRFDCSVAKTSLISTASLEELD